LTAHWVLVACFYLFLYPLSSSGGISINYSFVFLPLAVVLLRGHLKRLSLLVGAALVVFIAIFVLASLMEPAHFVRRVASFVVFMAIFAYVFIDMPDRMIAGFKTAVIVIAVAFSASNLLTFMGLSVELRNFNAKDIVGSQRYGFVYIVAWWLAVFNDVRPTMSRWPRYGVLAVISGGMLLTFSRATVVSFAAVLLLFGLARARRWVARPTRKGIVRTIQAAAAITVLLFLLNSLLPVTFAFFKERLDAATVSAGASDPTNSIGMRFVIWGQALSYVEQHPLTGSGFLGVWVLPELEGIAGSAHNQYLDVLFRTGVVGMVMYLSMLGFIVARFRRDQRPLFWGVIGVLIYGLFHETFKESQGACLLAVFLGIAAEMRRRERQSPRPVAERLHS
jgi:O-antigen ligase